MTTELNESSPDPAADAAVEVTQAQKDEMNEGLAPWCVKFRTADEYKQGTKR